MIRKKQFMNEAFELSGKTFFWIKRPVYRPECMKLTALKGERISFQAACTCDGFMKNRVKVRIESELKDRIRVRKVESVPVGRTCCPVVDDNYLKTESGMYPDLLRELKDEEVDIYPEKWRSLWIDIEISEDMVPGIYPITVSLEKDGKVVASASTEVTII